MDVGSYILVEEAQRVGMPLMDALDMLKNEKEEEQTEADRERMNEQSMAELEKLMQGRR